jgi:hypothetical protein
MIYNGWEQKSSFSDTSYRVALLTTSLFNYTNFTTTLVSVPVLFLAPYFMYASKFFVEKYDTFTGKPLNDE